MQTIHLDGKECRLIKTDPGKSACSGCAFEGIANEARCQTAAETQDCVRANLDGTYDLTYVYKEVV